MDLRYPIKGSISERKEEVNNGVDIMKDTYGVLKL